MTYFVISFFSLIVFFPLGAEARRTASVNVEPVKTHHLENLVRYSGRVEPEIIVSQSAQFPGQVAELLVNPNQRVTQNQVLMRVTRRAIGREYSAFEVRANIEGKVNELPFKVGMEFNQGDTLVELVDVSNLIVRLNVSDKDRHLLRPGQSAEVSIRGDQNLKGDVYKLLLRPTDVTPLGLFPVEIKLNDPRSEHIGQLVEVRIVVEKYEGIAVPRTAVIERDQKSYVFVYDSEMGTVSQRSIELGRPFGPMVAIENGLELGVQLVTESSAYLNDGEQVNLRTNQGQGTRRRRR